MAIDESYEKHAEVVTPIWGGLVAIHRKPGGARRLRIRWFRLLGSVIGLAAVFWLMIALGLYFWFKLGRGFQNEKFSVVLGLPFHWPPFHSAEHDKTMGDYFYNLAEVDLKYGHLDEAYNAYHTALVKTPDNLDAREKYAEFTLASSKNLDTYLAILEDGIPYALADNPNDYLNKFFMHLIQAQVPDRVERIEKICLQYLAENSVATEGGKPAQVPVVANPKVRAIFALNLANVYIDEGRFDQCEDTIKKYELEKTLDGVLIVSRLDWERGQLHQAVSYIEKALPNFGLTNKYLLTLLSRYYRDLGDLDKSQYYTLMRAQADQSDAAPLIELLYIYAKKGNQANLDRSIEALITQYHGNAQAMTLLENFATDQGDIPLALRLYQLAQDQDRQLRLAAKKSDFTVASFALLVAETYLTNNDYKDTIDFLGQLRDQKPDWLTENQLLFDSMRAVALYAQGHETDAEMYVNELISSTKTRPDTLLLIANRFLSHSGAIPAQRLLAEANRMDPHNQAILAQLIATNLQLGISENMDKNIHSLLETRRPPSELLYDAYRQLASDHFIFVSDREKLLTELGKFISEAAKNHRMDDQS